MSDFLTFTLFGSNLLFAAAIAIIIIAIIFSQAKEQGWYALVAVASGLLINQFWGDFPIAEYISWPKIGLYIVVGFVYSVIRTWAKGKKLSAEEKKTFKLQDHVYRWWLMWPTSLLVWSLKDLIKSIYDLIYAKLSKMYEKIFNS